MACYFSCPKCRTPLREDGTRWVCPAGHSYDKARAGYVNLLPPSGKGDHGDDKVMVSARRAFLESGHYAPLADALAREAARCARDGICVLDAGCGEGYYTHRLYDTVAQRCADPRFLAVDISRAALTAAAKGYPAVSWAAASVYALPVPDRSVDLIVDVFSPLAAEEYARVLKPGGTLLYVIPLEDHLFGLKSAIYEKPYYNRVQDTDLRGFTLESRRDVHFTMTLGREDAAALFTMTPYFHKTSPADRAKLDALTELQTPASFGILSYRRTEG